MDRGEILEDLANRDQFPADTVSYCLGNAERSAAIFLPILGKAASGGTLEPSEEKSFYLGLHILAALKIPNTLPLLLDLAADHPQRLYDLLGDVGLGETFPRLLMCLSEGYAADLWRIVKFNAADFMIRDAFLRAWTFEVLEDRVNAVSATQALRQFLDADDAPPPDDPIWTGWLTAIGDLGYSELQPVAARAVKSGRILTEDGTTAARDFEGFITALQEAENVSDRPEWLRERGYVPFGSGDRDWGDCFLNAPQSPVLP